MEDTCSFFYEFRGYSLQNYPVDKLLKKFGAKDYSSCLSLDKVKKKTELYHALAFIFSIHYLITNLPEELPDNIREDVAERIRKQGIPYELDNYKLEKGLSHYFGYSLPRRSNEYRDIVYTRIRESGYSHLRFAQEICKYAINETNWNKIVEKVELVEAYGNKDEICEIRDFFSKLTQSNFEDSFIGIGYSAKFAKNLKERLTKKSNTRSAWQLLEADIDVEYRNDNLYFDMPLEKSFPTENQDEIEFVFQLTDGNEIFCCYKKCNAHDINYQRYHMDSDIPVSSCREITRNGKNVFPSFLEGCFVIWNVENKICRRKLNFSEKLPAEKEYVICPTVSFDSAQHKVEICNIETQETESVELPHKFKGDENIAVVITADQRYEITFNLNTSLLDYDKIVAFSPNRIKYRYFSDDEHPFKDDLVSDDDSVTIICENAEKEFSLQDWNVPEDFLYKKCTLIIKKKKFQNIVFFSKGLLKRLTDSLIKDTHPIGSKVRIQISKSNAVAFAEGVSSRILEINNNPVKLEIIRKGVVLDLRGLQIFPKKTIELDIQDFETAKLKYFHEKEHRVALTEATVHKNGSFLNCIAAHKVTPPYTEINMLNIKRSYADMDLFSEPEITIRMFLYSKQTAERYNKGVVCKQDVLRRLICCENKNFKDFDLEFKLTDYTLDPVVVESNNISHKISYTLSKEEKRFLYCLPVEKQDGEFIKIDIAQKVSLEGEKPWQKRESLSIENLFTGELANSYGILTFFVYEKNGIPKRYSPGFFLKNPNAISIDALSPIQKALCACDTQELNAVFSQPGNQEFIEKVFENAENINAAHFFNCFFNKMRNKGRYTHTSSFAFRAADYWLPAAFTMDENGNETHAMRHLKEHWDFELFGYEETKKYLPDMPKEELIKKLKKSPNAPAMGSLYYSLTGKNIFDDDLEHKLHSDDLLFESKIIFLTKLFENKDGVKVECGKFNGDIPLLYDDNGNKQIFLKDLIYAIDELARRIHLWKKDPHLSEIRLGENGWIRDNKEDVYYYTEQYFRGELVYWRNMSAKAPVFTVLRNLLLCRIAQYAREDGIEYNIN